MQVKPQCRRSRCTVLVSCMIRRFELGSGSRVGVAQNNFAAERRLPAIMQAYPKADCASAPVVRADRCHGRQAGAARPPIRRAR
jgi:hypothetical protein